MAVVTEQILFAERYRLIAKLGSGAFSEVWKAEDTRAGDMVVALKIFAPDKGITNDGIKMFSAEYRKAYNLRHSNILGASHFDVFDHSPFLVMPYCKNGSLFTYIADNHEFSEIEIATIIRQIGGALRYIHKAGLLHQDIKPENLFVFEDGKYMLGDFGISSKVRRIMSQSMVGTMEDVKKAASALTPVFAPPELNRAIPTPKWDIFSFGVTLYEAANDGNLPYDKMGEAVRQGAHIPDLPDRYSEELNAIIKACMEKDVEDRPSAAELMEYADSYLRNGNWPIEVAYEEPSTAVLPETELTEENPTIGEEEKTIENILIEIEENNVREETEIQNDIEEQRDIPEEESDFVPTEPQIQNDISTETDNNIGEELGQYLIPKEPEIQQEAQQEEKEIQQEEPEADEKEINWPLIGALTFFVLAGLTAAYFFLMPGGQADNVVNADFEAWGDPFVFHQIPQQYHAGIQDIYKGAGGIKLKAGLKVFGNSPNAPGNWLEADFDGTFGKCWVGMFKEKAEGAAKMLFVVPPEGKKFYPFSIDCDDCTGLSLLKQSNQVPCARNLENKNDVIYYTQNNRTHYFYQQNNEAKTCSVKNE